MTKDVSRCVRAGLWPGSPSPDLLPVTELPPASWARMGALGPSLGKASRGPLEHSCADSETSSVTKHAADTLWTHSAEDLAGASGCRQRCGRSLWGQ